MDTEKMGGNVSMNVYNCFIKTFRLARSLIKIKQSY